MKVFGAILTFAAFAVASTSSQAMPVASAPGFSTNIVHVADGCGQGRYRGPGGACHRFGHGPYPGGYFAGSHRGEGCGPGRYRGPGGACHRLGTGPYPSGYWAPR
jgi:hypothetical protein